MRDKVVAALALVGQELVRQLAHYGQHQLASCKAAPVSCPAVHCQPATCPAVEPRQRAQCAEAEASAGSAEPEAESPVEGVPDVPLGAAGLVGVASLVSGWLLRGCWEHGGCRRRPRVAPRRRGGGRLD